MRPAMQNYEPARKSRSVTIDVSFVALRVGEFVHIDFKGQAVEVRVDDAGNIGVCVSSGVDVATFGEVYGDD